MGDPNSLATYVALTVHLFHDITQCYPESLEPERDLKKLRSRVRSEGVSFLTKTLPSLGKAIDMALHSDAPLRVSGFKLIPGTSIPRFLGWLIRYVFNDDGYVKHEPDITALTQLREFLYFTYKLKLPYDETAQKGAVDSFVRTQEELSNFEIPSSAVDIANHAAAFLCRLFVGFDVRDIIPRHGPGAVATGEEVGEKSNFSRIYRSIERCFPYTEYFVLGLNQVSDQFDDIQGLEILDTGTAQVVLVPKDSRGPRLISKEPLEKQWIQQGIQRKLYSWIEEHPLTSGFVNFSKQSINRRLALESSRTQRYVTLDMKDASDRVTYRLVERLFGGTGLWDALVASRSTRTLLPDGREIELSTFAPMGSAVCFPIEALTFYALALSVLHVCKRKYSGSSRELNRKPDVYIYGDDIILRREDYAFLMQWFPEFGLKFNEGKCCVSGFFRESCGCDAYKGIDVTPIRLRNTWSHTGKRDPSELVSYVELSNSLWEAGYWQVSTAIQSMVERRYGVLPYVKEKTKYLDRHGRWKISSPSVIGWYRSHVNHHALNRKSVLRRRLSQRFQRIEYKTWVVKPKYKKYQVDGWKECLRVLNTGSTGSATGVYALPHRVCLRRGWAAD